MLNFVRNLLNGETDPEPHVQNRLERPASVLEIGGMRATHAPNSSYFGDVRLQLPDEIWPEFHGKPLWPLCQLNLTAAPFRPEGLRDLEMITVFISQHFMEMAGNVVDCTDVAPVGGWFIRCYSSMADLVEISPPDHDSPLFIQEARWRKNAYSDFPDPDKGLISLTSEEELFLQDESEVEPIEGLKLGGWPNCLQTKPWWEEKPSQAQFEYMLQIDSDTESNWSWGDGGIGFLARSRQNPNKWALDYQFQ